MPNWILYVLAGLGVTSTVVVVLLLLAIRDLRDLVKGVLTYLDTGEVPTKKKPWWKFWNK